MQQTAKNYPTGDNSLIAYVIVTHKEIDFIVIEQK